MTTTTAPAEIAVPRDAPMELHLDGVRIAYGSRTVVDGLGLNVRPGEILVLTGPSGCGKSTVLRAIAGLLPIAAGQIVADGRPVSGTDRDRAMVFQDDALHPWRTVRRNVTLALGLRGVPRAQRKPQAEQWIKEIGLDGYADYLPKSLSGGMRQRVQLARGLAGAPRAVLMDEPFGALDAQTRATMQQLLIATLAAHPATVVFVTHDVDEALLLGDRVVVLGRAGEPVRAVIEVPHPRAPHLRSASTTESLREQIGSALRDQG